MPKAAIPTPGWVSSLQEAGMKVSGDSGLLVVDVITAINGVRIKDFQDLIVYLEAKTKVGDSIAVTLLRGAKKLNIQLTLTQRPDQS